MKTAYSTSCEIVGEIEGSINEIALHDFTIFKELFDYDFIGLEKNLGAGCIQVLMDYRSGNGGGKVFNRRVRDRICDLARSLETRRMLKNSSRKSRSSIKSSEWGNLTSQGLPDRTPGRRGDAIVPITNIAHGPSG